jgi:phage-related protein/DNA-binding XRE family transcriptional regulator
VPIVRLVAYREVDRNVPLRDWLDELPSKARDKCLVRLQRLAELGHELRRPEAAPLRDGIHELRMKHQTVNYRMLYFFVGRDAVVVSHGFTKAARSGAALGDRPRVAPKATLRAGSGQSHLRLEVGMKQRRDSLMDYLNERYVGADPKRLAQLEKARASAQIARQIHALRKEAGLSQRKLAELVGTKHSVISRLEDDDYGGHSLSMLRRIAAALGKRVEIRFVDDPRAKSA